MFKMMTYSLIHMHAAGYATDERLFRSRSVNRWRNGDTSFTPLWDIHTRFSKKI